MPNAHIRFRGAMASALVDAFNRVSALVVAAKIANDKAVDALADA
jgi:hypothetical protein